MTTISSQTIPTQTMVSTHRCWTLRDELAHWLPFSADRIDAIRSYDDVGFLEVRVNWLRRCYRPGRLCMGDAAHAMSPIAGVGIDLAVQDAVASANLLSAPPLEGRLTERYAPVGLPRPLRLLSAFPPLLRLFSRFVAIGVHNEHMAAAPVANLAPSVVSTGAGR